jgi:hypothetical protein
VLRYTPAVAYSGTPAAVQHDWSNLVAEWNYSGGGLASVSLYTGFQNTGGAGSLPWQVTIGSTNFTESGNVVAGGRYTMRIVTSPGPGTEVKVVKPIADSFRVMNTGSSVLSVSYIRVPDATLVIPSNDAVESTGTVGLLGTGSKPSVTLYNPVAPATMYRAKAKLVTGYLKPRHTAGTYPVRLYTYRYEGGKWVYRGYVNAKAYDYSTYTKYAAWVSLPYTGKWAIRAYAPEDSLHAATFSGYDYVTVLDVTVGNPIAPAAMYKGKVATVYGTLSPRHTAGTYPVRIYKWRYEGGAWKS